ncbi:unnamed protein product, partial [Laminaria digitata]
SVLASSKTSRGRLILAAWAVTRKLKRAPCSFRSKGHTIGLSMTLYSACRFLSTAAVFLLVHIASSVLAEFREGDVVPMSYMSQFTGASVEDWETPWDEALRSQMPRYGRPGKTPFNPALPEYSSKGKLAVALAFSKERFVLPRVTVREAGEGSRLSGLVLTFVYAAGDIVRVRSDPVYGKINEDDDGSYDFDIEYRWDRLPEEDEQAGVWLIFAVSLVVTMFLAVDVCNSPSGEPEPASRSE